MDSRENLRIRNVSAIPRQQIVYPVVSRDRDMKRINNRFLRKNCTGYDLIGDDFDVRIGRRQRYAVERLKTFVGKVGVAVRGFIDHVLGRHKFVVGSFVIPPLMSKNLTSNRNNLRAWLLPKIAHDRCFNVDRRHECSSVGERSR